MRRAFTQQKAKKIYEISQTNPFTASKIFLGFGFLSALHKLYTATHGCVRNMATSVPVLFGDSDSVSMVK